MQSQLNQIQSGEDKIDFQYDKYLKEKVQQKLTYKPMLKRLC